MQTLTWLELLIALETHFWLMMKGSVENEKCWCGFYLCDGGPLFSACGTEELISDTEGRSQQATPIKHTRMLHPSAQRWVKFGAGETLKVLVKSNFIIIIYLYISLIATVSLRLVHKWIWGIFNSKPFLLLLYYTFSAGSEQ